MLQLIVETINSTSSTQAKQWLEATQAHVVMLQEIKSTDTAIEELHGWTTAHGWKMLATESRTTDSGGISAGVAVLARDWLGLRAPSTGHVVVKHRLVAGLVQVPGFREFVAYSGYWWCGEGLSARNAELLAAVGEHVEVHGMSFILGGDFNMPPQLVEKSQIEDALECKIVHAGHHHGTCVTKNGSSIIDFFLVDVDLATALSQCEVCYGAHTKPHRPVRLKFQPAPVQLRVLRLKKPPPLPATAMIGPRLPCGDWSREKRMAKSKRVSPLFLKLPNVFKSW